MKRDITAEEAIAAAEAIMGPALDRSREEFSRKLALIDLLASPEPPKGLWQAMELADASWGDWHDQASAAWAWLRRQAGLEGEGK